MHSEEGLPHERLFAIACKVGDQYVEIGKGKSKKLAKRMAAHHMADKLRSLPTESGNVHAFDDDDDRIIEKLRSIMNKDENNSTNERSSGGKSAAPTFTDIEKIAELYSSHIGLFGEMVDQLKVCYNIFQDLSEMMNEVSNIFTKLFCRMTNLYLRIQKNLWRNSWKSMILKLCISNTMN